MADESGNALPEYAIVLSAVTILSYLAFLSLSSTSANAVTTNQNNLSGTATANFSPGP